MGANTFLLGIRGKSFTKTVSRCAQKFSLFFLLGRRRGRNKGWERHFIKIWEGYWFSLAPTLTLPSADKPHGAPEEHLWASRCRGRAWWPQGCPPEPLDSSNFQNDLLSGDKMRGEPLKAKDSRVRCKPLCNKTTTLETNLPFKKKMPFLTEMFCQHHILVLTRKLCWDLKLPQPRDLIPRVLLWSALPFQKGWCWLQVLTVNECFKRSINKGDREAGIYYE